VVESTEQDVDDAVASCDRRFPGCGAGSPRRSRRRPMWRWADLITAHVDELAVLDSTNMGKPVRDTAIEAGFAARVIRYWAGMAGKISGEQIPAIPGHLNYTLREPVGVCAAITPWNGPMAAFALSVAPPVACGNAVVAKPSELAPLSGGRFAELAVEAGLPPGLINVVHGGAARGACSRITGESPESFSPASVETGRHIASAAAGSFKKVALDWAGSRRTSSSTDADLDSALRGSVWGVFSNSGHGVASPARGCSSSDRSPTSSSPGWPRRAPRSGSGTRWTIERIWGRSAGLRQYNRVINYLTSAGARAPGCWRAAVGPSRWVPSAALSPPRCSPM